MSTVVEQRTVTLPFLDDEVPALFLCDRKIYLPVYKVCQALGIPADMHIRHWKNLALWFTARKLPFRNERQGKRQVWCLPISSVPFLYGLFDWHCVTPERRLQLKRACQEQARLVDQAYREMQWRYRAMRQALFTFLTTFADIDQLLTRYKYVLSSLLDSESCLTLIALIERGGSLFQDAATHARKMLHDMGELPIIDTFMLDTDYNVLATYSMPLLPIVSQEDSERFFSFMMELSAWRQQLHMFWLEPDG